MKSKRSTFGGKIIQMPRFSIREKIGSDDFHPTGKRIGIFFVHTRGETKPPRNGGDVPGITGIGKPNVILTKQEGLFSEITLEPLGDVSETREYDLEFGE